MTTRRESILTAIRTALTGTTGVGTRIYRSRVTAIARQESPSIIVEPVTDSAEQNTALPTLDWSMVVAVAVVVRGDVPDQQADPIVESMHSRLMSDLTLGGYAIDIQPQSVNFDLIEADQPAGVITCNYLIRYRTSVSDLTTA